MFRFSFSTSPLLSVPDAHVHCIPQWKVVKYGRVRQISPEMFLGFLLSMSLFYYFCPFPFLYLLLLSLRHHFHSLMQIHFALCYGSGLSFCIALFESFFRTFLNACVFIFFIFRSKFSISSMIYNTAHVPMFGCYYACNTHSGTNEIFHSFLFLCISLSILVHCCFEWQRYHLTCSHSCAFSIFLDFLAVSFHLSRVTYFVSYGFFSYSHLFFVQQG